MFLFRRRTYRTQLASPPMLWGGLLVLGRWSDFANRPFLKIAFKDVPHQVPELSEELKWMGKAPSEKSTGTWTDAYYLQDGVGHTGYAHDA